MPVLNSFAKNLYCGMVSAPMMDCDVLAAVHPSRTAKTSMLASAVCLCLSLVFQFFNLPWDVVKTHSKASHSFRTTSVETYLHITSSPDRIPLSQDMTENEESLVRRL